MGISSRCEFGIEKGKIFLGLRVSIDFKRRDRGVGCVHGANC